MKESCKLVMRLRKALKKFSPYKTRKGCKILSNHIDDIDNPNEPNDSKGLLPVPSKEKKSTHGEAS